MTELFKSIEAFLEKNNLSETLKSFKNQSKKLNHLSNQKNFQQINQIHKCIISNDEKTEHQIRQHLQKTDPKYLKRFVERIKKMKIPVQQESLLQSKKLSEMKFFKNLMEKQRLQYEGHKENLVNESNRRRYSLDESRVYENQWESQNDLGFQFYEFPSGQLDKVVKEISALKNYEQNAVKYVPYPDHYYQIWNQKIKAKVNMYDKLSTKLPTDMHFEKKSKQTKNDGYPLESEGVVYGTYDLRVIYDREKTGFQEEKDLKIVINEVLAGRYQIISVLGQAQFSRAIEVKDLTTQRRYCLKIITNNKEYLDQSLDEIKILKYIKANCNPDEHHLLNLHDYFYHKEHLMLLTELLKENLLQVYQENQSYFSLNTVQSITKQILMALDKLHDLHITHCDLKPQNILIKSVSNKIIKVIDVGSSIFFHDKPYFYIQTRSYRAPEILLGCSYTENIDMWSLGCILAEIYTGRPLFYSQNAAGLLAKIQGLRGPWPSWMIETGKEVHKYFTKELVIYENVVEENKQTKQKKKTGFSRVFVPKMTNLKSRVNSNNKNFLDFLSKCLKIDPSVRMNAKQALKHPFLFEQIQEQ